ncbi:MAG: hypothetical protein ACRD2H_00675 [Terriglobales bacterium]
MDYERMDWIALDNFLTTHPALKKIARWFFEHPDETLTAEVFSAKYGLPTTWLDLKGLAIHKVLTALDKAGRPVALPFHIGEETQFRFNRSLNQLVGDVLAKTKPAPRPDTVYPEEPEFGNTGGRTWRGWRQLPGQ